MRASDVSGTAIRLRVVGTLGTMEVTDYMRTGATFLVVREIKGPRKEPPCARVWDMLEGPLRLLAREMTRGGTLDEGEATWGSRLRSCCCSLYLAKRDNWARVG